MQKLHEGTLDYTRQRKQFGIPIAKFQVLQHRMVDMFMEVEQARSMTIMGTLKLDLPAKARMIAVSAAKNKVARGANFVGQNAIQTHGGIGITQELAIGHYFRSEEHTSELQSLMRISYAVFCLKKKKI